VSLERQQRDWEDLARLDPRWAIVAGEEHRFGRWDTDAFLETGRVEVTKAMRRAERLGRPTHCRRALEFGCGTGRVTRALAAHFGECVGVDISPRMVDEARGANADVPGLSFELNAEEGLGAFASGRFDLVYSRLPTGSSSSSSRATSRGGIGSSPSAGSTRASAASACPRKFSIAGCASNPSG